MLLLFFPDLYISKNSYFAISFSKCITSSSMHIIVSKIMLNNRGDRGHPFLIPDVNKKWFYLTFKHDVGFNLCEGSAPLLGS